MKKIVSLWIITIAFLIGSGNIFAQTSDIIYAGTSSLRGSKGLYVFNFDRKLGKLNEIQTVSDGDSPNFIAMGTDKKHLYVVYNKSTTSTDGKGSVMSYIIEPGTGLLKKLNEQSTEGAGPAHVSVDPKGRFVYVSNYNAGNLAVFPINKDGSLGNASDIVQHTGSSIVVGRQEGPHVHSTIPSADGKFIYVSDLGTDKIMIYEVKQTGKLAPAAVPFAKAIPGAGPRHLVIHPNGKFAYSAEELTYTVSSYAVDKVTGALTSLEHIKMIPEGFIARNTAADIHFSPDGKFLYASNRGHESLVIFEVDPNNGKLSLVGNENTGGKHPRNFMIDKEGEYVLTANRDTDNIVVFRRDKKTGKLVPTGEQVTVPAVIALQQL